MGQNGLVSRFVKLVETYFNRLESVISTKSGSTSIVADSKCHTFTDCVNKKSYFFVL